MPKLLQQTYAGIGSTARLGETKGGHVLSSSQLRKVLGLLLICSVQQDPLESNRLYKGRERERERER